MTRPTVAQGISVHPSPNRRHVVVRLHDDDAAQTVLAMVLMDVGCARKTLERLSAALGEVSTDDAGTAGIH